VDLQASTSANLPALAGLRTSASVTTSGAS
jgi:hypothetical protein